MTKQPFVHKRSDLTLRDAESAPASPSINGAAGHTSPRSLRRQRLTVFLPSPLLERLRNAVYWTRQRPLAQIIAGAIEDAVLKMEQTNEGTFPPRLAPLKPGRPRRASGSRHAPSSRALPLEHS